MLAILVLVNIENILVLVILVFQLSRPYRKILTKNSTQKNDKKNGQKLPKFAKICQKMAKNGPIIAKILNNITKMSKSYHFLVVLVLYWSSKKIILCRIGLESIFGPKMTLLLVLSRIFWPKMTLILVSSRIFRPTILDIGLLLV